MSARLAIVLAAIAGCTWGAPPPPALVGVSPSTLMAGRQGLLTLTASGLDGEIDVDFDDPGQSASCDWFRVVLHATGVPDVELADVVRVSQTELRGRVPAEADRAVYDVTLVDPRGGEATLAAAFAVEKCPPPFADCDDGNPCTTGDSCLGADRCAAGTSLADGTPCDFDCTGTDAPVPGACDASGRCVPLEGACPPAPTSCEGQ